MIRDEYKTIETETESAFRILGSKFLGFAYPVTGKTDIDSKLTMVKELHPKATHHCYAYKWGKNGINYRANDDGEPAGSAGRPILGQIESLNLNYVLVIVVRYFGGTKLGVPGLVQAYKEAAKAALDAGRIVTRFEMIRMWISFPYIQSSAVMQVLKKSDAHIIDQEYNAELQRMMIEIRESKCEGLQEMLHTQAFGIYPSDYLAGLRSDHLSIKMLHENA